MLLNKDGQAMLKLARCKMGMIEQSCEVQSAIAGQSLEDALEKSVFVILLLT